MAFCKQCGTDLGEGKFCPNCGSAADGNIVNQQTAPVTANPRQQTLLEMNRMHNHFGSKADIYRKRDTAYAEIKERSDRTFFGWIVAAVLCVIIGIFSKAIFFFIATIPFIIVFVLKRKKNKKILAMVTAEHENLSKQLNDLYAEYGYCPIGQEYTHPDVFPLLYGYVSEGRANTTSEAINCLIADLNAADQKAALDQINKNVQDAARTAKDARNIAAADFIFK